MGQQHGGISVADLLTLPELAGVDVVGGRDGLNRPVRGANVMEVPDIEQFVHAGDILLTTAYPVRDRADGLTGLLQAAARLELAALAVKPLRYVDDFTDEVVALANELDMPLLRLPPGLSFNSAMAAVLSTVLSDYGPEPGPTEAIRQRLSEIVLSGGGFVAMARTLAGTLGCRVSIIDEHGHTVGEAGDPVKGAQTREFLINVAGQERGRIEVVATELSLGQQRLINQACFAAGLHMAQLSASIELDRRLQAIVLEELVAPIPHAGTDFAEHALALEAKMTGPQCIILARTDRMPPPADLDKIAKRVFGECRIWARPTELVAIVAVPQASAALLRTVARGWYHRLRAAGGQQVLVAAGSVVARTSGLPESHAAARMAMEIAERTSQEVAIHQDLMVDRLLLEASSATIEPLIASALSPLIEYDQANGTQLCQTLWAYLGAGNGATAARLLFIHYNTLKYRLGKIDELVGADFSDPDTRLRYLLALQAHTLGR
ncbi:MAG: PucR family transcriptional regulator [Brooklawnia sp.]